MVLVKATFQKTVRRFTVPDDLSYESLRKKLVDMFPEMKGVVPESVLMYYRDSDNDLVIVSSDDELHTAQHHLVGDDGTLKLLIAVKHQESKMETSQQHEVDSESEDDLIDDLVSGLLFGTTPFSLHHHHHRPSSIFGHNPLGSSFLFDLTPSWSDRRRLLQQQEERVRKQREYEDKLRKAHQEHVKEMRERMKKEQEKRRQEELDKKKTETAGEVAVKENQSGSKPAIPNFPPGWVVNPYGSWEPVVYHHPLGGRTHVWGPWGYTATYGDDKKDSTATTQQEDDNKQEQQPMEEGEQQPQQKEETTAES